jgi:hypothetical protein
MEKHVRISHCCDTSRIELKYDYIEAMRGKIAVIQILVVPSCLLAAAKESVSKQEDSVAPSISHDGEDIDTAMAFSSSVLNAH